MNVFVDEMVIDEMSLDKMARSQRASLGENKTRIDLSSDGLREISIN